MENKIEDLIVKYKDQIKGLNSETAISHCFSNLLNDLFSESNLNFVEEYLGSLERYIEVKGRDLIIRGKLDAFYGNAIIEFKNDIIKKKEEAEKQQNRYLTILLDDENNKEINYLSINTDGKTFFVYCPEILIKDPTADKIDIKLILLAEINIFEISNFEFYLFLDRYLFRKVPKVPDVSEFIKDFGLQSPTFNFTFYLLKNVWFTVKDKNPFNIIFSNWDNYLSIAYGTKLNNDELFLRHTFLSIFSKILLSKVFSNKSKNIDLFNVLKGDFFSEIGIINFLEEDFFSWVTNQDVFSNLEQTFLKISQQLDNYSIGKIITNYNIDLLKELYQQLVDPETRHDLGEYYTPDWLAEKIVSEIIPENPKAKFLDPSCGSGTFLMMLIKYKKQLLMNENNLLDLILDSVFGFDVHPLAVTISKANYLLALGDLLKNRKNNISIPIYLTNSIWLRKRDEFVPLTLDEQFEVLKLPLADREINIPLEILENNELYDEIIGLIESYINNYYDKESNIDIFYKFFLNYFEANLLTKRTIDCIFEIAQTITELKLNNKDTIWIFILKNLYKPYFFFNKFDFIIGNPPWLVYRNIKNEDYKAFVKDNITIRYNLGSIKDKKLFTHLEIATLFFLRCCDLYLKKFGKIVFILPRSIYSSDHHDYFRQNKFIFDAGMKFYQIWDLKEVKPMFKVPSCVLFGEIGDQTIYPFEAKRIIGKLSDKNLTSHFPHSFE
ncbi:MAG: N-6 DNA methylase [Candidatus Humimicrobiaceae bacterium]